jgi:hypothetical protein
MDTDKIASAATVLVAVALAFTLGFYSGRWSVGVDSRECIDGRVFVRESATLLVANGQHCARLPLESAK